MTITAKMTDTQVLVFEYKSTIDEEIPKIREFIEEMFLPVTLLKLVDNLATRMKSKNFNGARVNLYYNGVHLLTLKPLHENKDNPVYGIYLYDCKQLSWRHQVVLLGSCLTSGLLVIAHTYGLFNAPTWIMKLVAVTPALLLWILW